MFSCFSMVILYLSVQYRAGRSKLRDFLVLHIPEMGLALGQRERTPEGYNKLAICYYPKICVCMSIVLWLLANFVKYDILFYSCHHPFFI